MFLCFNEFKIKDTNDLLVLSSSFSFLIKEELSNKSNNKLFKTSLEIP
jgi:predicted ATPase